MLRLPLRHAAVACALTLVSFLPFDASAQESPRAWMDGFSLVVLDTDDIDSLHRARKTITAHGGWIALMSPPSLLMGWIPPEVAMELRGKDNIRAIHYSEVDLNMAVTKAPETDYMLRSYNDIVSGRYDDQIIAMAKNGEPPSWPDDGRGGDAYPAEAFDYEEYLNLLIRNGLDPAELRENGTLTPDGSSGKRNQSDDMSGTVAVALFLVESDGTGSDPDAYTWDPQHVQDYINGTNVGLAWWSWISKLYNNCWVGFMVRPELPTNPNCQQPVEIVLHEQSWVSTMVDNVMTNFGFPGSHFSQTEAYNTWQVNTYGTDRAFCAFVGYNFGGPSELANNGPGAFAYLLGPYTFLLYQAHSWAPDQVFTHETGHIFGACDEYASGCSSCAQGCTHGFTLGNCEADVCFTPCMMASNTFTLCNFTDGHLGWRNNPCAPPPLTPPTITSLSPPSAQVGTTLDITVTGTDLLYGAFIELGANTTQNSTTYVNSTTVIVNVTIDEIADPGLRDAEIINRDLQSDILANGFDVIPTSRHYVDPLGSNTFPYTTRMTAANTLSDVFTAVGSGDSVLVVTGTTNPGTIQFTRAMKLYGGWDASFTSRDIVNAKSIFQVGANIQVKDTVTFDGFIFENGSGRNEVDPVEGVFGGALRVTNAELTVSNCELRNNSATAGGTNHGGGAIYVKQGTLNLIDSEIHGNESMRGGAIYMYQGSGTISGNHFHDNLVDAGGGTDYGGAIYLTECSNVNIEDNLFENNTGASFAGAVYVEDSSNIVIHGGTIQNTSSATDAGAIYASNSSLSVEDVIFIAPSTGGYGGAIQTVSGLSLTVSGNSFSGASGNIGGVLALDGGTADLRHNLFTGNDALFGSAIFATNLTGGSLFGNTIADNLGASSAVYLSESPLTVSNNILSNHAGQGFNCAGAALPVFSYNDVFATGLDPYLTCVPGVGSISADPNFVDAPGGDYHLGLHSAALDAGDPDPANNDPDGGRGDLGWYGSHSFVTEQPSYPAAPSVQTVGPDIVVSWSANPEGDIAQYAVYGSPSADFVPTAGNLRATVNAPTTMANLGPAAGDQYFKLCAVDLDGYSSGFSAEVQADATGTGTPIYRTRLLGNVPNPFNPSTLIQFEIARTGNASVRIYDVAGRLVRILLDEELDAGRHERSWDGRNNEGGRVASGSYFYRLETVDGSDTGKMLLVK